MLDEIVSKNIHQTYTKSVIHRSKRSKTPNKIKPVGNIKKTLKIFLEICPEQKEDASSQKQQHHLYE